jgi:hypothetical protein
MSSLACLISDERELRNGEMEGKTKDNRRSGREGMQFVCRKGRKEEKVGISSHILHHPVSFPIPSVLSRVSL